jgi:hypothetical protein
MFPLLTLKAPKPRSDSYGSIPMEEGSSGQGYLAGRIVYPPAGGGVFFWF